MFGKIFKDLRKQSDYNQENFAKKIGLTRSTISDWETGRSEPNIDQLSLIADIFNCSVDYLIGREDDFGAVTLHRTDLAVDALDRELLEHFRKLDVTGKNKVIGYAYALAH